MREHASTEPGPLTTTPAVSRHRITRAYDRLKTTFVEGKSAWTPVLVTLADYVIWGTAFVVILTLAELAYHFG